MKKKDAGAMLEDLYPMKKCSLEFGERSRSQRLVVCSKHRSVCVWLLHACCMHSLSFIVLFPGTRAGNSALDEGHAGKH